MRTDLESSPMGQYVKSIMLFTAQNISGISYKSPFTKNTLIPHFFNLENYMLVLGLLKMTFTVTWKQVYKIDLINLTELSLNVQASFKNSISFQMMKYAITVHVYFTSMCTLLQKNSEINIVPSEKSSNYPATRT